MTPSKKTLNILFITIGDINNPSTRFRIYQFLPYFERDNIVKIKGIISIEGRDSLIKLGLTFFSLIWKLLSSDIIFLSRAPLPPFIINILTKNKFFIYDYDDALFAKPLNWPADKDFDKRQQTINHILSKANMVIAGNAYLAEYSKKYCQHVTIIPTVVDTGQTDMPPQNFDRWQFQQQIFQPHQNTNNNNHSPESQSLTIGWIGTPSNIVRLNLIGPALKRLQEKYPFVKVKIVSSREWHYPGLTITNKQWQLEDEITDVQSFDIGLMPLNKDDPFAEGKCGFKIIEYMAVGCPAVADAIGVNQQIIEHGKTGFLVYEATEWESYLEILIQDAALREKMSKAARQRVIDHYSISAVLPIYQSIFDDLNL